MAFRAQTRKGNQWLASPHKFEDGDELWFHSRDERDAHEFATRKEARDTINRITNGGANDYKIVGRRGH